MKKVVPPLAKSIIAKVKSDMAANKTARDARIKEYNGKVLKAYGNYRAPEPEVKKEDKDPAKAESDKAVEEMKELRKNQTAGEQDLHKMLTAQLNMTA